MSRLAKDRARGRRWLRVLATLAAVLPGCSAAAQDLAYPPSGVDAPVAGPGGGARATTLTAEEAAAREALYRRGHLVIRPDFGTARPAPQGPPNADSDNAPAVPAQQTPLETSAPATAAAPAGGGLLWRVDSGDAPASYVFGTIHVDDRRVLKLPARVRGALLSSRSFTMEVALGEVDPMALSTAMYYGDARTLASTAGPELAGRAALLLAERGIPQRAALIMKPWAAAVTLSSPATSRGEFLDAHLHNLASQRSLPVFGLESIAEQFAAFEDMAVDDQVALLRQAVAEHREVGNAVDEMIDAYLARDLRRLQGLARGPAGGDQQLADEFMRRVVTQRNLRMVERMQARLRDGGAFIAIGALHLPGERGVVALLRERGYGVTAVY